MPILKIDDGKLTQRVGHYLNFDREGNERAAAFVTNTEGVTLKQVEAAFDDNRTAFDKHGGIEFYQAYLCFKRTDLGDLANADGSVDPEKLASYAKEWAERAGIAERHQYYAVVHDEPDHHPHIHLVWNSVSSVDGKKFHYHATEEREGYRDINDKLAREHGIQYIPTRKRDSNTPANGVLRATERGAPAYSWKADLARRVRESAAVSMNEKEFRQALSGAGVDVRTRDKGYSYGFSDARGEHHACRASKLGEECQKANLAKQFEEHRNVLKEGGGEALGKMINRELQNPPAWREEFRKTVDISLRHATSEEDFASRLAGRGIGFQVQPDASPTLRYTSESGTPYEVKLRDLGPNYDWEKLTPRFDENLKRRTLGAAVYGAVRKAEDEDAFRAALQTQGVTLEDRRGKYYYHSANPDHPDQPIPGEALGPSLRTEAVKNRLLENGIRSEAYGYLRTAMKGSRDLEGYERTLRDHGIEHVPAHDDHAAMIHFKDQAFKASAFGKANPERVEVVIAEKALVRELRGAIRDAVDAPHYHKLLEERGVVFEPAKASSPDKPGSDTAQVRFRDRTFEAVDLKQWNPELVQAQLDRRDAYQVLISSLKRSTDEPEYRKAYQAQGVQWNPTEKDGKTLHFRETNFDPKDVGGLADPAKYQENRTWVRTSRHLADAMGQAGSPEDFSRLISERGVTIDERGVSYEGHSFSPKSFGPNNPENVELALAQRTIREHLSESLDAARAQPEYLSELAKRGVTYRPAEGDRAAVVVFNKAEFPAEAFGRLNPEQFTRNIAYKDAHESLARAAVEAKDLPHYDTLLHQKGIQYTAPTPDRVGSVTYAGQSFQAPSFHRLDPANAAENLAQRRAYEHLSNSLGRAVSEEHYHELLREKGIQVHRTGEQGQITVKYGGYAFPAAAFGHKSPEHYAENAVRAELHGHLQTALAKAPTEAEYHQVLAARGVEYRPAQDLTPASVAYQGRSYAVEGFDRVRPDRFSENRAHLDLRTQLSEALKEAKTPAAFQADLAPRGIERIPATPEVPAQIRFAGHSFEAAKLGRLDPARSDEAFNHRDAHALMSAELRAAPRTQEAYLARLEQHGITYRPGSATDAPIITYKTMTYPASSFGWSDPDRFPEHIARQNLYTTLSGIRRESSDVQDYLTRIQAAGIHYQPGPRPYFEQNGHVIEARQLGNVDPERAQFYQHGQSIGSWASAMTNQTRTLTQVLTAEIVRQSYDGYVGDSEPARKRRRRRRGDGAAQSGEMEGGQLEDSF